MRRCRHWTQVPQWDWNRLIAYCDRLQLFVSVISRARSVAACNFGRPVLLIYGDSHNLRDHTSFRERASQLVALEVFGTDQMHAVEVLVQTTDPSLF